MVRGARVVGVGTPISPPVVTGIVYCLGMDPPAACPHCSSHSPPHSEEAGEWSCKECGHRWRALRIFLSYGHDQHTPDAVRIKEDLTTRGFVVWFDAERIVRQQGLDAQIEAGLSDCDRVVVLMTPYSMRRRDWKDPSSTDGYCLNELARAIELNKPIIPVLLVEVEGGAPVSIARLWYLDFQAAIPLDEHAER